MKELTSFTFVDPLFFEAPSAYEIEPELRRALEGILPAGWSITRKDIWLMASPEGAKLPKQGFKLHVSATPATAEELLRRVVPAVVEENLPFKIVADAHLVRHVNSKNYGRGSSSKFIVIYPGSLDQIERLGDELHRRTEGMEGAYILSDRRFKESRVLYYRYGGFQPLRLLNADGTFTPAIEAPDGSLQPDERLPYFKLPPWVRDPFEAPGCDTAETAAGSDEGEDDGLLKGRYRVEEALAFSNCGGVYRGVDVESGRKVVLKEARPWTNCSAGPDGDVLDAVAFLEREYRLLQRLAPLGCVVQPLDFFREWEHAYLVEEHVEGLPLSRFRASDSMVLVPFTPDRKRARDFSRKFHRLATNLLEALTSIHSARVLVGDLSPNNVFVDPESLEVTLIDFETSVDLDEPEERRRHAARWATPGFRSPGRRGGRPLRAEDDYYALGMILFSLLLPIQSLFELTGDAVHRFLTKLAEAAGLPREVPSVIRRLLEGDADEARRVLESWPTDVSPAAPTAGRNRPPEETLQEVERTLEGIGRYLEATYDVRREDRLWPADYTVFLTNPVSLAYGACGPLLLARSLWGEVPRELEDWLLSHDLARETVPPGLYVGLAGAAFTLAELGRWERAREVLDEALRSPLRLAEAGLFDGAAGLGLSCLDFHRRVGGEEVLLDRACEIGDWLASKAETRSTGCCWTRRADGQVHFGAGYGASGIALFLLRLYQATGATRYLDLARQGLAFELAHPTRSGGGAIKWGKREGDTVVEPYWLHGAAGIGSVVVRFYEALGEEDYLRAAEQAGEGSYSRFTVQPGLFEGLSGIGELMLDLHRATGDDGYLERARRIAESVLEYRIERPEGIAFPGRYLLRISNDLGTGAAGVGMFLHRLLHRGARLLHDLDVAGPQPSASRRRAA